MIEFRPPSPRITSVEELTPATVTNGLLSRSRRIVPHTTTPRFNPDTRQLPGSLGRRPSTPILRTYRRVAKP